MQLTGCPLLLRPVCSCHVYALRLCCVDPFDLPACERSQPAGCALHSGMLNLTPIHPNAERVSLLADMAASTTPLLRAAAVRNVVAQNARMAPRYTRQASGHGAATASAEQYPTESEWMHNRTNAFNTVHGTTTDNVPSLRPLPPSTHSTASRSSTVNCNQTTAQQMQLRQALEVPSGATPY